MYAFADVDKLSQPAPEGTGRVKRPGRYFVHSKTQQETREEAHEEPGDKAPIRQTFTGSEGGGGHVLRGQPGIGLEASSIAEGDVANGHKPKDGAWRRNTLDDVLKHQPAKTSQQPALSIPDQRPMKSCRKNPVLDYDPQGATKRGERSTISPADKANIQDLLKSRTAKSEDTSAKGDAPAITMTRQAEQLSKMIGRTEGLQDRTAYANSLAEDDELDLLATERKRNLPQPETSAEEVLKRRRRA